MSSDPYSVLGVPRTASDEEIKKAYRSLSRKYHPDANINNPDKEAAEAKFKDVQQAYQTIMDERENPGAQNSYGDSYGGFGGFGGFGYDPFGRGGRKTEYEDDDSRYMKAVVNYINNGSYNEALNLLNSIKRREGMWYYYSAVANSGVGNNVTAVEHINAALSFEPNNMRYMQFKRQLESGESWYAGRTETYGFPGAGGANSCSKLCTYYLICSLCSGGGRFFCCV